MIRRLTFSCMLLLIFAAIIYQLFRSKPIQIPSIERPKAESRTVEQIEVNAGELAVSLPVSLETSWLIKELEAKLPMSWMGEDSPSVRVIKNEKLRWRVQRKPLKLISCDSSGVTCSCQLSGRADLDGKFDLGIKKMKVSGHANVAATVTLRARPTIAADWTVSPNLSIVSFDVSKADVPIKHVGTISIRGFTRELLQKEKAKLLGKANARIASDLNLKSKVTKVWRQLHQAIQVPNDLSEFSGVKVWLVSTPEKLEMKPISYSAKQIQTVLGLQAKVKTIVTSKQQSPPKPSRMPQLGSPGNTGDLRVRLPVIFNLDCLNKALQGQLSEPIALKEDGSLKIMNASLFGIDDRLYVKALVCADLGVAEYEGAIYFVGRPVFDVAKQELKITDFDFTVESRNVLVELAAQLVDPLITEAISRRLVYDLRDDCENAKKQFKLEFARFVQRLPDDLHADAKIKELHVEGLRVNNGYLVFSVSASGRAQVFVN